MNIKIIVYSLIRLFVDSLFSCYYESRRIRAKQSFIFLSIFYCSLLTVLSGCAVHKFQKSEKLGGYAVARFGYEIPEYTIDLENKAPGDFKIAKERFKRRNDIVEEYYMKMGQIESYFRRYITHYPILMADMAGGVLTLPFHIVSGYRYDHNEKYRAMTDEFDRREREVEDARVAKLRQELMEFIKLDLEKERELDEFGK